MQVWPEPCDPDHECSINSAKPEPLRSLLVAQIQVLDLKPAPRLEPVEDQSQEQIKQGRHRGAGCAPLPCHVAKPALDGIFGRDAGQRTFGIEIGMALKARRINLKIMLQSHDGSGCISLSAEM